MKTRTGKTSIIAVILAFAATLSIFTGCTEEKTKEEVKTSAVESTPEAVEIDIDAVAESLRNGVKFDDALEKLEGDAVGFYYDIKEGVSAAVYFGSGATAEEIAVFDGGDSTGGDAIEEMVKNHVSDQIESYKNYVPDEVARLEKAVIVKEGRYVFLCVTYDVETAKGIISKAVGK